ncbi:MAG: type II toxin-antitoxin system HicB family antitoxin [Bacteroidetes bacterium]|nr:type II toxin-antitoxin system HicB family antitoxin [Bacteroidota bacterium]
MRQIILTKGEDGFWVVECPSLPGCISQGETKEEAIINIKEAIQLYTECLLEDGIEVPEEKYEAMTIVL